MRLVCTNVTADGPHHHVELQGDGGSTIVRLRAASAILEHFEVGTAYDLSAAKSEEQEVV